MASADVVLASPGVATLEAALLRRPMVITSRMSRLEWWRFKRRRELAYCGIPNLLAGEEIAPERLQDEATPDKLAEALVALLTDREARTRMEERFEGIRQALRQNTAEKVAAAIMPLLGRSAVARS
jgi:lipid-A-disaccharide synthase